MKIKHMISKNYCDKIITARDVNNKGRKIFASYNPEVGTWTYLKPSPLIQAMIVLHHEYLQLIIEKGDKHEF